MTENCHSLYGQLISYKMTRILTGKTRSHITRKILNAVQKPNHDHNNYTTMCPVHMHKVKRSIALYYTHTPTHSNETHMLGNCCKVCCR